jgi:hypothetical protein
VKIFLTILRLLGHLLFVGGAIVAAIDLYLRYSFPHSGTWQGIFFLGITAILGFPWSLVVAQILGVIGGVISRPVADTIGPIVGPIALSSGMFINYGIFLWITKKMKERIARPKASAA